MKIFIHQAMPCYVSLRVVYTTDRQNRTYHPRGHLPTLVGIEIKQDFLSPPILFVVYAWTYVLFHHLLSPVFAPATRGSGLYVLCVWVCMTCE